MKVSAFVHVVSGFHEGFYGMVSHMLTDVFELEWKVDGPSR